MEKRLRELEEKLKKSEEQRQKLKDNLVRCFTLLPLRTHHEEQMQEYYLDPSDRVGPPS